MGRNILLIIVLLALTCSLIAQSNYKQGYIITNENDSISGWIDFRTDKINSSTCRFKTDLQEDEKIYYPGDIQKYKFIDEGKYYISKEITIDSIPRKVFLEYLLQGMIDLYFYSDPTTELDYYIFQESDGKIFSLSKKKDQVIDFKRISDEKYKRILAYIFKDQPTMSNDIQKSLFDRKSMIGLAKEYHSITCTTGEQCIVFENNYKKQFIKIELSAYAGIQIAKYSLPTRIDRPFDPMKSLSPVMGGQLNFSCPRWSNVISLQADISVSGMKGSSDYTELTYNYTRYDFDALLLMGKLNLKLTYPSGKIRPMVEVGLNWGRILNQSSSLYTENSFYPAIVSETREDYAPLSKTLSGYNIAIGVNYRIKNNHSVFCSVSYEDIDNEGKIKITQIKIGYTF